MWAIEFLWEDTGNMINGSKRDHLREMGIIQREIMLYFIILMQICQMLENSINIWQMDSLWCRVNTYWGNNKALLHIICQLPLRQAGLPGQASNSSAGGREQPGTNQWKTLRLFGWKRVTKVEFFACMADEHLSMCLGLLLSPLPQVKFYSVEINTALRMKETELDNIDVLDFISIKATLAEKTIIK